MYERMFSGVKQGAIIKVVFDKGMELKGCYVGDYMYVKRKDKYNKVFGKYLVVIDYNSKRPKFVSVETFADEYDVKVKSVARTRLSADVSKTLKAIAQEEVSKALKIDKKREKMEELAKRQRVSDIKSREDSPNTVKPEPSVEEKLKEILGDIESDIDLRRAKRVTSFNGSMIGDNRLRLVVVFDRLRHVSDEDLGVEFIKEYDYSYSPKFVKKVNLNKVVHKYLGTRDNEVSGLVRKIKGIKGVNLLKEELFEYTVGEYPDSGEVWMNMMVDFDEDVSRINLVKFHSALISYIRKVG